MSEQYVELYDLLEIYEDIETKAGPGFVEDFKAVLHEATLARYDEDSTDDVVARYSNNPNHLLWRDGEVKYPDGVFYFTLIERKWEGSELVSADNVIFILIDYPQGVIIDKSSGIIRIN